MIRTEIQVWHAIYCDECDAPGPYAATAEKANEKAEKQGWFVFDLMDMHLCPEHIAVANEKRKPTLWKRHYDEKMQGSPPTQSDSE